MRIKDELFGKEVLDADIQIVGKVSDVVLDKNSFEQEDSFYREDIVFYCEELITK